MDTSKVRKPRKREQILESSTIKGTWGEGAWKSHREMKTVQAAGVSLFQTATAGPYPEVNAIKAGICRSLQGPKNGMG